MNRLTRTVFLAFLLALLLAREAGAETGHIVLVWYGGGSDGHLGKRTAFVDRWDRPSWLWRTVRADRPGIALAGYAPGTAVRITVVGMPAWAASWSELDGVVGRSTVAYVSDRPGACWYGDAWKLTFGRLAPLWVGRLYVEVEVIER